MAKTDKAGDSLVTAKNCISELLAAPLEANWTIESLAEQVLSAIALRSSTLPAEGNELVLDAVACSDRQSNRLLRPLLACLAGKSAAELGTSPNLYGGRFKFERPGREGPVWIVGEFINTPGEARVAFRISTSPPKTENAAAGGPTVFAPADALVDGSPATNSHVRR